MSAQEYLERIWRAALAAADPYEATSSALPPDDGRMVLVVGAGKAAARMAEAAEATYAHVWGVVATPPGHGGTLSKIKNHVAAHPVPDNSSMTAAGAALGIAQGAGPDDRLVVLLSGGASALWTFPGEGLGLGHVQDLNRALLKSGASIQEINTVRRHLSKINGGRLASLRETTQSCTTLIVSDVPGDDLAAIGSGPTVGDPTTLADARRVLERYGIDASDEIVAALNDPANESVKPGDPRLENVDNRVILNASAVQDAAEVCARALGYEVVRLGDHLSGDAGQVAREHAKLAQQDGKRALISGGELTVTGAAGGEGGRCREYALALAVALGEGHGVHAAALDTDGIDGAGNAAGAWIGPDMLARARAAGLDADACLAAHESGRFFKTLGHEIVTGPTRTNVSDFRVILTG